MADRPTPERIVWAKAHWSRLWSIAHSQWLTSDSYYARTYGVWPAGFKTPSYHPSTATNTIDHAIDTQFAYDPHVHRPPAGEGKKYQERADRIEPFIAAVIEEAGKCEVMLPQRSIATNMCIYGYSPIEGAVLDRREYAEKPKRKVGEPAVSWEERQELYEAMTRNWNPFRIRVPHPSTILMNPLDMQPSEAIKVQMWYANQVKDLSLEKKKTRKYAEEFIYPAGVGDYDLVEISEHWTREWHTVLQGGAFIYQEKNSWGFLPFAHAYAGWGHLLALVTGATVNSMSASIGWNPGQLAKGLLDPIQESLKIQAQALSSLHTMLVDAARQKYGTTEDGAEIAQALSKDRVIELPNEKALWKLDGPDFHQSLFEIIQILEKDIEWGTYASSLAGQRQTGVNTVGQETILSGAAQRKFASPNKAMERLMTIASENILRLVDVVLEEPIAMHGITIRPEDIDHNYVLDVTFELNDPTLPVAARAERHGNGQTPLDLRPDLPR